MSSQRRSGRRAGGRRWDGPAADSRAVAVVGTVRRVGKTVVAAGLARALALRGVRVGVFKPVAIGCHRRMREGLVCPDSEFLAHCADAPHDLATINPLRYAGRLVPAECAAREHRPLDLAEIERCRARITADSDYVVTEMVGGLVEPLDRGTVVADLLERWSLPVVLVASAAEETINNVLMAIECTRERGLPLAAVALNRYTADGASLADEIQPELLARYSGVDLPVVIPQDKETDPARAKLGPAVVEALTPLAASLRPAV